MPIGSLPGLAPSFASFYFSTGYEHGLARRTHADTATERDAWQTWCFALVLCNWLIAAVAACAAPFAAGAAARRSPLRIVVLGDSLVAGFQLKASDAFPAQLERALKAAATPSRSSMPEFRAIRRRPGWSACGWAVPERTDAVILELGANDALRGLDPGAPRPTSTRSSTHVKAGGAEVLLAGMLAPRNLGEDYTRAFDAMYPELAKKHGAAAVSVLSRRHRAQRRAQPGRRHASQRQGRRRDHQAHPAGGRGTDRARARTRGSGSKG